MTVIYATVMTLFEVGDTFRVSISEPLLLPLHFVKHGLFLLNPMLVEKEWWLVKGNGCFRNYMGSFLALTMKEHVGKWLGDKSYTISTKENILKMDVWAKRPCTLEQLFVKNVLEAHDVSTAVKLKYICLNKTNWSYKTCAQVSNKYSTLPPYKMGCKTYFSYKNIWGFRFYTGLKLYSNGDPNMDFPVSPFWDPGAQPWKIYPSMIYHLN